MVEKSDVTTARPSASDLVTVNDGETIEASVENDNNSTLIAPLIVAMNWIIDQGLQAAVESTATALQRYEGGIEVNAIASLATDQNIVISPKGTGKIYRGSVTADNEIPTLSETSTGEAQAAATAAQAAQAAAETAQTGAETAETNAETAETNAAASEAAAAASAVTAASYAAKVASLVILRNNQAASTGDAAGNIFFRVPTALNGFNLTGVAAAVYVAGTTGTLDIQIHNITQAADMLSTKITIDSGEKDSSTAATPPVINLANDNVTAGDQLRVDIDAVHSGTASQGLIVELKFEAP